MQALTSPSMTVCHHPSTTVRRWVGQGLTALATALLTALWSSIAIASDTGAAHDLDLARNLLLVDITRAGPRLIAVGERGHILLSDDHGDSWRQAATPARTLLTAVHFSDARHGWAVGHDALILHSDDGGEHWREVFSAPQRGEPLLDVTSIRPAAAAETETETTILAVGAYGSTIRSTDAGRHWHSAPLSSDDDFHLNALTRAADGSLVIAAEAGSAYRSDDGGRQWQPLSPPYPGSFFGALAMPTDTLLLFGLRGHLYRSTDAGQQWTRISLPLGPTTLSDAIQLNDGRIVMVGHRGALLWSDDQGISFKHRQLDGRPALAALSAAANGAIIAVGERGVHPISVNAP